MTIIVTTIDYRFIYSIFSQNTKIYLPQNIVSVIYAYLYSPKNHFSNYVRIDLWKQCWIKYKKQQIPEIQLLLDFLFDLWGISFGKVDETYGETKVKPYSGYNYNANTTFYIIQNINDLFPGDIVFDVDHFVQLDCPVTHITVRFENYLSYYFYVMNRDAYNQFCYYDGCHRYYWMFDVYETKEFHLLQATLRHI